MSFYIVLLGFFGLIGVGTLVHVSKFGNRNDIKEDFSLLN